MTQKSTSEDSKNKDEEVPVIESNDINAAKLRIKRAIESKGLKIKQFARESGMAYPSLRDYHSGLRKPGFEALLTIARFTGVSCDWLLLGKGGMFGEEEPECLNVEERLLARIAQMVEKEFYDQSKMLKANGAVEEEENEYSYAEKRRKLRDKLNHAAQRTVITGTIYNRVAAIRDEDARDRALQREVRSLVRLNESINATMLDD